MNIFINLSGHYMTFVYNRGASTGQMTTPDLCAGTFSGFFDYKYYNRVQGNKVIPLIQLEVILQVNLKPFFISQLFYKVIPLVQLEANI